MGTSGAFEASVNRVALERCIERQHGSTTGFPCASCVHEVRLEFLTTRVSAPIMLSVEESNQILRDMGFID